jgi:hypothetical protein
MKQCTSIFHHSLFLLFQLESFKKTLMHSLQEDDENQVVTTFQPSSCSSVLPATQECKAANFIHFFQLETSNDKQSTDRVTGSDSSISPLTPFQGQAIARKSQLESILVQE